MMKYTIYISILLLCFSANAFAQENTQQQEDDSYRFALGVQLGTDIGGAIPFPFKHVPSTFNPYPKLNISLGAKLTFPVKPQWTIGAETTYKTVAIDADARVKNQKFQDKDYIQYFTGTAEMKMEFTMLEVPVYVKYTFSNMKDRILVGPYFSWIMKSKFIIDPKKGFIGNQASTVDAPVSDDPLDPNYLKDIVFSNDLDSWDMGIVLGYERKLSPRIELGLRFMCGFKDIFKPNNEYFDYSMLHMRGTVVLSYNLFNIKSPKLLKLSKR